MFRKISILFISLLLLLNNSMTIFAEANEEATSEEIKENEVIKENNESEDENATITINSLVEDDSFIRCREIITELSTYETIDETNFQTVSELVEEYYELRDVLSSDQINQIDDSCLNTIQSLLDEYLLNGISFDSVLLTNESSSENIVHSINLGTNIVGNIYDDGLLVITGEGPTDSSIAANILKDYNNEILSIQIDDGVTTLCSNLFSNLTNIKSIKVPSTVQTIYQNAFSYCSSLKMLYIPSTVVSIPSSIINNCPSDLMIYSNVSTTNPGWSSSWSWNGSYYKYANVSYNISTLEFDFYCSLTGEETEINVPEGITKLSNGLFKNFTNLQNISLPNSLTSIGSSVFYGCTSLTSIEFPENLSSISDSAFYNCSSLKSITIPKNIVNIYGSAFYGCNGLETLSIPVTTSFSDTSFSGVNKLKTVNFTVGKEGTQYVEFNSSNIRYTPWYLSKNTLENVSFEEGILGISSYLLMDQAKLTEITLPESLQRINYESFYNCTSLTSINIPQNVTYVSSTAFSNCYDLSDFSVSENNTKYDSRDNCNALIETANGRLIWGNDYSSIPFGVESIGSNSGDGVFTINNDHAVIYVPSTVKTIEKYAFRDAEKLETVYLPEGLETIGVAAFMECYALKSINIPSSVSSLGDAAFDSCSSLEYIEIPDTITSFGTTMFKDCSSLKHARIPHNLTIIPDKTFTNCISLESVDLPNNYTSIGKEVFYRCQNLKEFTMPNTLKEIGYYAFYGCGFSEITIPNSVTKMGINCFTGCTNLEKLTIPVSTQYYTDDTASTFYNVTNLKEIIITKGDGVLRNDYLGAASESLSSAYYYTPWRQSMDTIEKVVVEDDVSALDNYMFFKASDIDEFVLPQSLSISTGTFKSMTNTGTVHITYGNGSSSITSSTYSRYIWNTDNSVENIIIDDGVSSLSSDFFYNSSSNVKNIYLPSSITTIGSYAFYNSNLTVYTGLASAPSTWTTTGWRTKEIKYNYTYEQYLDEINGSSKPVPVSENKCGDNAYYTVDSNGVLTIYGTGATDKCTEKAPLLADSSNIKKIIIEEGITEIGGYSFYNFTNVEELIVANSVTKLGSHSCHGMTGLKKLTMPIDIDLYYVDGHIIYISDVFTNDASVEEVILTPGTTGNGVSFSSTEYKYAPWYISKANMKSITIADGVKKIGAYTFYQQSNIKEIYIPNSVTTISSYAFYNCTGIERLTMPVNTTYTRSSTEGSFVGDKNINYVRLTSGSGDTKGVSINYTSSTYSYSPWAISKINSMDFIIDDDVTQLASYQMFVSQKFHSLTMPANLVFSTAGSTSSTFNSVSILENLILTGEGSLANFTSTTYKQTPWYIARSTLKSVTIGDGVTSIGDYAFVDCNAIETLTIPISMSMTLNTSSTTKVSNSFYNCPSINSVHFTKGKGTAVSYKSTYPYTPWYVNSISNITIDDDVEEIGAYTFYNSRITSIDLPSNLKSIGKSTFQLSSLSSVNIPYGVEKIESDTFSNCSSLKNVYLPDSVRIIDSYAFFYCVTLDTVRMPNSLESIGSHAFYNDGYLQNIVFPNTLKEIGEYAFYNCGRIEEIIIPDGIINIGSYAFDSTSPSVLVIPISLSFTQYTFRNVSGLKTLYFTKGTGVSRDYTSSEAMYTPWYSSEYSLEKIVIGEGVTSIGSYLTRSQYALNELVLPNSLVSVANDAFNGLSNINELTMPMSLDLRNTKLFATSYTGLNRINLTKGIGTIQNYGSVNCGNLPWNNGGSNITVTIRDGVTFIPNYYFYDCKAISKFYLPESLQTINEYAFAYTTANFELPVGVSSVKQYAFYLAEGLTKVNGIISSAGSYSFYYCANLTSISLSNSMTSLPDCLFWGCSNLKDFNIPTSCTSVGSYVFAECTSIESITIPSGITSIGSYMFSNCTNLKSVEIKGKVTSIQAAAFNKCSNLSSINIPSTVTSIGSSAFASCTSLTSFVIPNSVTSLGTSAFAYCQFTELTIPLSYTISSDTTFNSVNKVEIIHFTKGNNSVSNYTQGTTQYTPWYKSRSKIKEVTFENGITSIGNFLLFGYYSPTYPNLNSLTIPDSVTSIGNYSISLPNLESLTMPASVVFTTDSFDYSTNLKTVHLTKGNGSQFMYSSSNYGNNAPWGIAKNSIKTIILDEGITKVCDYMFYYCDSVQEIDLPSTITSIGKESFEYCKNLSVFNLPNNITSIGEYAFHCCDQLVDIVLPNKITNVGYGAFYNCKNLTSVTIPPNVINYDQYAFHMEKSYGTSKISSVKISDLSKFLQSSFGTYNSNPLSYGAGLYLNEELLTDIEVPSDVTSIGNRALNGYTKLSSITIPRTVTSMGVDCLSGVGTYTLKYEGCPVEYSQITGAPVKDDIVYLGLSEKITVEAKCETEGYDLQVCECGEEIKTNIIPALGHIDEDFDGYCDRPGCDYIFTYHTVEELEALLVEAETMIAESDIKHYTVPSIEALSEEYEKASVVDKEDKRAVHFAYEDLKEAKGGVKIATLTIALNSNPANSGILSGGGYYTGGEVAKLSSEAVSGYTFIGWYINDELVSDKPSFEYHIDEEPAANINITAKYQTNVAIPVNIYVGRGTVNYSYPNNSGKWSNDKIGYSIPKGSEVTLVANPLPGCTFMYWVDANNYRVLSNNTSYTFPIREELKIMACYKIPDESYHYVVFKDLNGKVLSSQDVEDGSAAEEPEHGNFYGYVFEGWDKDFSSVTEDIIINAVYSKPTDLTVTVINGTIIEPKDTYSYADRVVVKADLIDGEGKYFEGWYVDNELVSKKDEYSFFILKNTEVEARYGDTPAIDEPILVISVSGRVDGENNKQLVNVAVQHHLPESFEVVEIGVLRSYVRAVADEDSFIVENVDNDTIKKSTSKSLAPSGTYDLTISMSETTKIKDLFVRGYMTYRDKVTGSVITIYTSIIESPKVG